MIKNKLYILLAALSLAGGCSDNPDMPRLPGNIETVDGLRISIFHLLADKLSGWEISDDVRFLLVDPTSQNSFEFNGSIIHNTENGRNVFTCRVDIGDTEIPDGIYFVTISGENTPEIGERTVRFTNNIGTEEDVKTIEYSDLEGSGTQTDPYLISSQGDFLSLLSYLMDDPTHAYGKYFKQSRTFELPRRSQIIDGKVWAAVSFSGNYDGDGHRLLNLVYQGSSDPVTDSGIGLFKDIYASTISNLTITGALISNSCSHIGIIAGSASGNCTLENISVEGTIMADSDNIGGLIGYSKDNLTLKSITLNSLTVAGNESSSKSTGALVGCHENGNLSIDGVSTPDHIFSVTGVDNIGGLVGNVKASGKYVEIRNALLQHSVDNESAGVKIIHGQKNTGGLIGNISDVEKVSFINNQLKAPVSGADNTGGLSGCATNISSVTVEKCVISSIVAGNSNVGGLFGELGLTSDGTLDFNGADNATRLVLKSSAAAEVSGTTNVGGLVGTFSGHTSTINVNSKVEIALNISGLDNIGGAFGCISGTDINNVDNLNFSSTTMKVMATMNCAGGVAGYAHNAHFYGGLSLDPVSSIPDKDGLPTTYNGVVTAPLVAGGIVGTLDEGTVKGLATSASVTAQTLTAGGIVGKGSSHITECAFLGTATCPSTVGGILGYTFESTVKVTKCINYANLSDATYLGGIMGHYENVAHTHFDETYSARYLFIGDCCNIGDLSSGLDVGGIVACAEHSDGGLLEDYKSEKVRVERCGNYANVRGRDNSGKYSVGGVAGTMKCCNMGVRYCANLGKVSSSGIQKTIGGVVGHSGDSFGGLIYVEECMNNGEVSCDASSTKLGGVVGHQETYTREYTSKVENCLNWGALPGKQKDDTGGILGYAANHSAIFKCVNRGIVSHGNAIVGTHNSGTVFYHSDNYYFAGSGKSWPSSIEVTDAGLTSSTPFKNLDFKKVWILDSGNGPMLRNCPFQTKP